MKLKHILIFIFLTVIVSILQFIMAKKNLEMGFFTDDWLFLSAYREYLDNPILDIFHGWKAMGSHWFTYSYYIGVMYGFFELDYFSYRLLNLILKIAATISLYPLVLYLSKNKLLAFLSSLLYAIHFSSFGLLDGPSRGGIFIAITIMNLFLIAYFYCIKNRISSVFYLVGLAALFLIPVAMGATRLFPLLVIPFIVEGIYFFINKSKNYLKIMLLRLSVLYFPLVLLFLLSPESVAVALAYPSNLIEKMKNGNFQLLLIPFASFGSMFIPRELWLIMGQPIYSNLKSYLEFFLFGPMFIYTIFFTILSLFISKKPMKFIIRSLVVNLSIGVTVFLVVQNWLTLDQSIKTPVDPITFVLPSLIGLIAVSFAFCLFLDWRVEEDKNSLSIFIFLGLLFSLVFTLLTWMFADVNSVFTGVHAYLNIPSMGISIAMAAILILIFNKLKFIRYFGGFSSIIVAIIFLGLYFRVSAKTVDNFFSYWLINGAAASDQKRIQAQFWQEIGDKEYSLKKLPIIYFSDSEEYENGGFYNEALIWRLHSWFDLRYNQSKEKRFNLCTFEILGKEELKKFVSVADDGKTLINSKCKQTIVDIDDFFAFRLKGRNLLPNRAEVLKGLGIK